MVMVIAIVIVVVIELVLVIVIVLVIVLLRVLVIGIVIVMVIVIAIVIVIVIVIVIEVVAVIAIVVVVVVVIVIVIVMAIVIESIIRNLIGPRAAEARASARRPPRRPPPLHGVLGSLPPRPRFPAARLPTKSLSSTLAIPINMEGGRAMATKNTIPHDSRMMVPLRSCFRLHVPLGLRTRNVDSRSYRVLSNHRLFRDNCRVDTTTATNFCFWRRSR